MLKKAVSLLMALILTLSVFSINVFAYQEESEISFTTEISPSEEMLDTIGQFLIGETSEEDLSMNRPLYGSCKYYKVKTSGVPFFLFFLFFLTPKVTIKNNSSSTMVIDMFDHNYNHVRSARLGAYEKGQITFPKRATYYISCSYADASVSGNMLASVSYLGNSALFN